ncbi:MAG: hypothetical protein ACREQL_16215 [Candidatus Binatia bacterium]
MDADDALAVEARLFGRYLVGCEPEPALVDRYRAANRALFAAPLPAEDVAVVAFVRRHPWSIGFLDAASGLLRPGGLLRNKILLMAAILETTPEHADQFLPRHVGPVALVVRVGAAGTAAVVEALVGTVLHTVVARRAA